MSLDDDRMPTLMEHYKVPHCDAKGEANQFFLGRKVPTTFLLTSFYWENLLRPGMMGPGPDGALVLTLPMGFKKLPGIAAEDIGQTIGVAGEHLTGTEMATALSRTLSTTVRYNAVSTDTYRQFDFPGAEDIGNMFQFRHDFNDDFRAARDVGVTRRLNPSLQRFGEWLATNKERFVTRQAA